MEIDLYSLLVYLLFFLKIICKGEYFSAEPRRVTRMCIRKERKKLCLNSINDNIDNNIKGIKRRKEESRL
jgi:hypothetical protein